MGIFIPFKVVSPWKALIPILVRFELVEVNNKVVNLLQPTKALAPIDVTDAGIVTVENVDIPVSTLPQL